MLRILGTNMAAIHTSSMVGSCSVVDSPSNSNCACAPQAFTHAVFDLTTHPEYLLPMREEAERVIAKEGWTKAALNSMVKIDSFLRESQRLNNNGPCKCTVYFFPSALYSLFPCYYTIPHDPP